MKNLLIVLLSVLLVSGCAKSRETYQVVVEKSNTFPVEIEIDDAKHTFTATSYSSEFDIGKHDYVFIWASYTSYDEEPIRLIIKSGNVTLKTIDAITYAGATISRGNIDTEGGTYSSGSSSSGTCYCGAQTQAGTPCKRKVVCGSGYCWQHK